MFIMPPHCLLVLHFDASSVTAVSIAAALSSSPSSDVHSEDTIYSDVATLSRSLCGDASDVTLNWSLSSDAYSSTVLSVDITLSGLLLSESVSSDSPSDTTFIVMLLHQADPYLVLLILH